LDNLSNSQLQALCRLLGIAKIGTKEILRFRLQMKLKELQADDRVS
jgi:LETM1 and EF-hand domain-containing protein 1, mitochondrial